MTRDTSVHGISEVFVACLLTQHKAAGGLITVIVLIIICYCCCCRPKSRPRGRDGEETGLFNADKDSYPSALSPGPGNTRPVSLTSRQK